MKFDDVGRDDVPAMLEELPDLVRNAAVHAMKDLNQLDLDSEYSVIHTIQSAVTLANVSLVMIDALAFLLNRKEQHLPLHIMRVRVRDFMQGWLEHIGSNGSQEEQVKNIARFMQGMGSLFELLTPGDMVRLSRDDEFNQTFRSFSVSDDDDDSSVVLSA